MLSSMTGFGRSSHDTPFGKLIVEVQSVNRKHLDITVSLPKEFSRFEYEIRRWIGEQIVRGQVSLRIFLIPNPDACQDLLPDPEILRGLKKGWEQIASRLCYSHQVIDLPFLLTYSPIQQKIKLAEDQDVTNLRSCVQEALKCLVDMKRTEGQVLANDLSKRLDHLKSHLRTIEICAPNAVQRMREKLIEKLKEIKEIVDVDDRILREVAIFAERLDIAEEITRLQSHFNQFLDLLLVKQMAIGKKMDFLLQEMGREVNTIGSKSADAQISYLVVEMKSELEQMREQIQNIE